MPMERSRRNVYFWILITTLAHWVVECDKLDGYSFPVYNTSSCPSDQSEWRNRSYAINCTENNGYMCIPNENITELLEFCYRYQRIPIEKNICLVLKKSDSLVEAYSCKQFKNGCPDKQYWSNEVFEYPSCLSIGNGCFLDEPLCTDEGIATIGPSEVTQDTTHVFLGSTISNTSLESTTIPVIDRRKNRSRIVTIGRPSVTKITQDTTHVFLGSAILNTSLESTLIPDIGRSNTWVWILVVIGLVMMNVPIPVCALIFIFRRGNQKTLAEGHEEEEKFLLKMDIPGEKELFSMGEIAHIEYKDEIEKSEGNQELDGEILLLPANTKTLDKEYIFGDISTNEMNRKQFEEEIGEKKPDYNSLSANVVEKQEDIQCIEETSKKAESPSEDIRKEKYSSSNKDISKGINSYLSQQEGSDRINSEKLKREKIDIEKTEEEGEEMTSNVESLKNHIAGKYDDTLYLYETNRTADSSSEDNSEKEYFSMDEDVPEGKSSDSKQQKDSERICLEELIRDKSSDKSDSSSEVICEKEYTSLDKDVCDEINRDSKLQEDIDRMLEKLARAGIHLDGYEVWKTEMSEKFMELSNEDRAVLYLILCSRKNIFILENTEALTKQLSKMIGTLDVSKNINESIRTLQSKGLVSIENEKVTFASDDVQDETMFDYLHTCSKKSKVIGQESSISKYMHIRIIGQYSNFIYKQLLNVSPESSVKYFRSRNFDGNGKFVRIFKRPLQREMLTYEEIFTRSISKRGKDILIHDILDDKSLHSTISSQLKIPEEVLLWDLDARKRYLEYLKKGKTPIYRARAMIVGCAGAGKTTLLERLQKKSLEDILKIKSTVGLDVHNDIFEVLENERKLEVAMRKCEPAIHIKETVPIDDAEKVEEKRLLSILDFGGQCMYYACHQIYLSKRAFYILVIDMSKNLNDVIDEELCDQKDTMFSKWSHGDYLLFWLKSVNCYCGNEAPVILVATHAEEKSEQEKTEYYQELIKTFPVSSTIKTHLSSDRYFILSLKKNNGACIESLDELEKSIVEVVKSQKQWGEEIPLDWAIFEKFISEKKETKLQKLDKLKESFDKLLPLSTQEFKDLLRFYNDIGVILYFSSEGTVRNSPEIVILDIQWFVNSFKYVMTDSKQASFNKVIDAAPTREALETFTTTGEISGTFLKAIWTVTKNQTAVEYKDDMMKYMERLGLLTMEEKSDIYFIPSMNRMKVPEHVKSKIHSHPNKSPTLYIRFPVLPVFLFYRLIVLCLKSGWKPLMDERKCIYIDAAMFYHQKHVLVLGVSESYIQLLLYNDDDDWMAKKSIKITFMNVKREVLEMLSSLTNTFNRDLRYQVGYSCTPTEFGKELDNTFMTGNYLIEYNGNKCPLHAHAEDHDIRTLRNFLGPISSGFCPVS